MTLREAAKAGIRRVRQPQWANPVCYLRLDLLDSGHHGPWARLYDRPTQEAIGAPTPQELIALDSQDTWEAYTGAVDSADLGQREPAEEKR